MKTLSIAFASAFALAAAGTCHAQSTTYESVSEAIAANPMPPTVTWRGDIDGSVAKSVSLIQFQPMNAARVDAVRRYNDNAGTKPLQIGIVRDIASEAEPGTGSAPALDWRPTRGGHVARLDVVSPEAAGLRVGVRLTGLPAGAELRVAGSDWPDVLYLGEHDELTTLLGNDGLYWTAVTDGELQTLELFVPDGAPRPELRIEAVSHLLVSLHTATDMSKALGSSGSCQIDVVCKTGALGERFVSAKNAVARYTVQSGSRTLSCSGTLLNDTDDTTWKNWFISAQHCVGNQGEANTLRSFWRFETPTCRVDNAGPNIQVGGGAQLVYANSGADLALMRLHGSPPAGAIYAGWSATPLATGSIVHAIHHPAADIKKYSRGRFFEVTANVSIGGNPRANMLRTTWLEGTTEGGSSGSGLFVVSESGGYQLRGTLSGGSASCSNAAGSIAQGNYDYYANFAAQFPALAPFLSPGAAANGPSRNYTGNWFQPDEPGRGISLYQYSDDSLLGLWFVYDSAGRASWYQLDTRWTGPETSSGRVVRWTGPAWGPGYSGNRSYVEVGQFSLRFTSASQATLSYSVDGVSRTIQLSRIGS